MLDGQIRAVREMVSSDGLCSAIMGIRRNLASQRTLNDPIFKEGTQSAFVDMVTENPHNGLLQFQ